MTATEVSAPNWILQHVSELFVNDMEKISKKLPHIQVSLTKEGKIVLKGPLKQVRIAEQFLYNLTASAQPTVIVDDVRVNRELHGRIIGKNGATVDRIRKETRTSIYFPSHARLNGMVLPPDVIRIQGYPESVEAAKRKVLQIVARFERFSVMNAPYEDMSNDPKKETYHEVIHIDKNIIRYVLGRRGATADLIERTTRTLVSVRGKDPGDEDTIVIIGNRENVHKARKMITDIEDKMKVVHYRLLNNLEYRRGEEKDIPMDNLETRQEDEKLFSHQETVNVNPRLLNRVVGRNCVTISKLAEKHDVHIRLPKIRDGKSLNAISVTIVGPESKTKAAKDDLDEIIKELEAHITEPVNIPRYVHHHLIGYKGRKMFELQDQFDVEIWFPKTENEPDIVTIRGRKENVEDAKGEILSLANYFLQRDATRLASFYHVRQLCLLGSPEPPDGVRFSQLPVTADNVGGNTSNKEEARVPDQ